MSEFVKVAQVDDLSDPGKVVLPVDDRLVVLIRRGQEFYCIDDVCTHDGGTLGDGELLDCELMCPRHGAKFDIRSGEALTMPATENTLTHEVKVDGTDVLVRLSED